MKYKSIIYNLPSGKEKAGAMYGSNLESLTKDTESRLAEFPGTWAIISEVEWKPVLYLNTPRDLEGEWVNV